MLSMNKEIKNSIGILISGRGTNMENIILACERGIIPAQVSIVVSDNSNAAGINIAQQHKIPTNLIERKSFASKEEFESEMIQCLNEHNVDIVCLAGFMKILSPVFIRAFPSRILNIHPALLPSFPGLHAQRQAFEYGVKITGATVHFVDEGVDTGPIIIQCAVPVDENDTEETLSAKILQQEHKIYPEAIRLFFENKLTICERKVKVSQ